jgi:hypothetical protein
LRAQGGLTNQGGLRSPCGGRACPVPAELDGWTTTTLDPDASYFRVYASTWGHDEFNPGFGDSRFAPISPGNGARPLSSMYVAQTPAGALLETTFHELHHVAARSIFDRELHGMLLASMRLPRAANVIDLRDNELERLGLERSAVVATTAEHYPCTQALAAHLMASATDDVHGIVWHSRQAELTGHPPTEVAVLFGTRFGESRGQCKLTGPGVRALHEGPGRLLVDEIAEAVGATIQPTPY